MLGASFEDILADDNERLQPALIALTTLVYLAALYNER